MLDERWLICRQNSDRIAYLISSLYANKQTNKQTFSQAAKK
jgi:hypothetical protein